MLLLIVTTILLCAIQEISEDFSLKKKKKRAIQYRNTSVATSSVSGCVNYGQVAFSKFHECVVSPVSTKEAVLLFSFSDRIKILLCAN